MITNNGAVQGRGQRLEDDARHESLQVVSYN